MAKVYFVGAGPGDPELITVKGRRLLEAAGMVIYAGSLVNPALCAGLKAELHDSAPLTLEEIIALMARGIAAGKTVVRLQTGDLSFYSALAEQTSRLRALDIPYEVVPGVTSASAGAASAGLELTLPEVTQTVIFTRLAGLTPVPEKENLRELARHQASMVIFLSVAAAEKVKEELLPAYGPAAPVMLVEKASWPEERILTGRLDDLGSMVRKARIGKTALIYVGPALTGAPAHFSRLYHPDFRHAYRP
jgi:precorrin-4/cobalt-precorrin-4 C11-methyltransferase